MVSTDKTDISVFEALRASKLASELSSDQCRLLAGVMTARTLADGEVLVHEGTTDDRLQLIVAGALAVVRNAGNAEETTLFAVTPGDLVGEMSFLDDSAHYASRVARGRTQVISLTRERLKSLLATDPWIVYRVMRAFVRTVHEIQRRLSVQSIALTNYIYKQHGRY